MMIARWSIDARYGHKPIVVGMLKKWHDEIGTRIGWTSDKVRLFTGLLSASESVVQVEVTVEDLAELNRAWETMGAMDAHEQWKKDLEPHISGSPRWELLRLVE